MDQLSTSFLIVANGQFLPTEQLLLLSKGKIIVALDHAGERLLDINIVPDIIIGDFDSIDDKKQFNIDPLVKKETIFETRIHNKTIRMIYRPDQNETDLFKAMCYVDTLCSESIHIVCAWSQDRLDHLINNLRALRVFYQKNRPVYFYTDKEVARYVKDETLEVSGEIGSICGVLGFPSGHFSSTGLKYNGNEYPLIFGFSESVANQFASEKAIITIQGEALFIQAIEKVDLV